MSAAVVDAAHVARDFRGEIREVVGRRADEPPLSVVGFLADADGPAGLYARATTRLFRDLGIGFEVRDVSAGSAARDIAEANADPSVDGIFVYYPVGGGPGDRWLRELVDPRKDVEGLHSFWLRLLYENRRFVAGHENARAIVPCTPLAVVKLLDHLGLYRRGEAGLSGLTACVLNRSDVVGRPLAAMLANDGARVYSVDIDSTLLLEPSGDGARPRDAGELTRAVALRDADVVIGAVPSPSFRPVAASEIKEGVICIDVAERPNFAEDALEAAGVHVPSVGALTTTMAARNLVRLAAIDL